MLKLHLLSVATNPTIVLISDAFAKFYESFIDALPGLLTALLVFALFFIVALVGRRFIALAAPRVSGDTGTVLLLSRVYYYGILILGALTALPFAGADVTALVTGLGLTGFAVGFALKDVLSNLLSGIMLLIYRPFQIGDHIKMGEHEGTIATIRMRDTVLHAADGRAIIIPNSKLITEVVVNNTGSKLLHETVDVRIDEQSFNLHQARQALRNALRGLTANEHDGGQVALTDGGDSDGATNLQGRFWYDPRHIQAQDLREELARRIKDSFAAVGLNASLVKAKTSSAPAHESNGDNEDSEQSQSDTQ